MGIKEFKLRGSMSQLQGASSIVDGGGLQIWRIPANTLNKQALTADNGWSSRLVVRRGVKISSP
jgi:hypothetical protein